MALARGAGPSVYSMPHVQRCLAPQALYWKYASCPLEEVDATFGSGNSGTSDCRGWCVLQWYRRYSPNLGQVRTPDLKPEPEPQPCA